MNVYGSKQIRMISRSTQNGLFFCECIQHGNNQTSFRSKHHKRCKCMVVYCYRKFLQPMPLGHSGLTPERKATIPHKECTSYTEHWHTQRAGLASTRVNVSCVTVVVVAIRTKGTHALSDQKNEKRVFLCFFLLFCGGPGWIKITNNLCPETKNIYDTIIKNDKKITS